MKHQVLSILLIFELIIKLLKNYDPTRDKVMSQFPYGVPAKVRRLFFFFWPYILGYTFYSLRKKSREESEIEIEKTENDFQSRLSKMAEEHRNNKEKIIKKSNFQTKLEKMAKEKK